MNLQFNGLNYNHRWSRDGQNEFTPVDQPDLASWQDMLTLNVHEDVATGEQLADVANRVIGAYQQHGELIQVRSQPATPNAPAEHLGVAWLWGKDACEVCFARFLLKEGAGLVAVYSRRTYGADAGPSMSEWLQENGASTEEALMQWAAMPALSDLRTLPQKIPLAAAT